MRSRLSLSSAWWKSVNVVVRAEKAHGRHMRDPCLLRARSALLGAKIHPMELMAWKVSTTTTPQRPRRHPVDEAFAHNAAAKVDRVVWLRSVGVVDKAEKAHG